MYGPPYEWDVINAVQGSYTPSMTHYDSAAFDYWQRSLFQRACSTLEIKVPDDWEGSYKDLLYYFLFKRGFVMICAPDEYGLMFNPCTLKGHNVRFQPTSVLVENPYMNKTRKREFKIGTECELLKLTPDFMGIWDIIGRYAEKLSGLDRDVDMAIFNMKTAHLLTARDKTSRDAIVKALDLISEGQPLTVIDKNILNNQKDEAYPFEFIDMKVKENYILGDLLRDTMTVLNEFDAEVGIPTIPYQKAERMVTSEAESRQIDATSRSLVWYETMKGCIEEINKHYGDLFDVQLRFKPEGGVSDADENNADKSDELSSD